MKFHGTIERTKKHFIIRTEPHVRMMIKRLFLGARIGPKEILITATAEAAENVDWLNERWPHEMSPHLRDAIKARRANNEAERELADRIVNGEAPTRQPAAWNPDFPLRDYQCIPLELIKLKAGLLIGDDLGLGKSAEALAIIADHGGKALIVCAKHLQRQWRDEVKKFCPSLRPYIVKTGKAYIPPAHDVTILTYTKLAGWAEALKWDIVVYDEVQELRHAGTGKYNAAAYLSEATDRRVGLSATPIYNYAGEIYNVMEALSPGALGTLEEFMNEWDATTDARGRIRVQDPKALGSWLRTQNVYIRRLRKDVGRELPPILALNHIVAHDPKIMERLAAQFNELAQRVLAGGFHQAGEAARQLDIKLRQTTGIAKAPFVADFVEEIVSSGEKVLLAGWHRDVYEVWLREFQRKGIKAVMFTGSETENQKARAVEDFTLGDAQVLIMSLRSGAGLNGLQEVCSTAIIGELDWSPQVIAQLVGRLRRDGQKKQVTVFTLLSDNGADPIISRVLGAKWESATAVTDPHLLSTENEETPVPESRIADLARAWLARPKKNDD